MDFQQIGAQHPKVKQALSIQNNTSPNRYRQAVVDGLWAHKLVLEADVELDTLFVCPEAIRSDEARKLVDTLSARALHTYQVSKRTFERLAERENPDGLVSIVFMPHWEPENLRFGSKALVLVADGIEIPGNLGTLIRTLDACAADLLVLTNRRTRLSHPKVLRGSQGRSLTVPSVEFDDPRDARSWLQSHGFTIYLADTTDSKNYRSYSYKGRTAFVVGSERYGINRAWYETSLPRVNVPMLGSADSLNVSVSASILLYEARAQIEEW